MEPTRGTPVPVLHELAPEPARELDRLHDLLWATLPPVELELCRLLIARLHGDADGSAARTPVAVAAGLDEAMVEGLAEWWRSDALTDHQRALLAFVEQFVTSVGDMTDAIVDDLLAFDEPLRVHEWSNAVWALDLTSRLGLVAREVLA